MYIDNPVAYQSLSTWPDVQNGSQAHTNARVLYERASRRSLVSRLRRLLGWGPALLQALPERSTAWGQRPGTQTVPIERIRGSESRSRDFDGKFRPLQGHTKERWISVAAARLAGRSLPPVELIAVGDDYYVRDGHHRISVAQTMGEQYIEALVMA